MAEIDRSYHKLVNKVLSEGEIYEDPNRKGVNRIQIPSYTFEHDFKDGFPAVSTKKLAWKSIVAETLWILRGETNIKYLVDNKVPIWNPDAYNHYLNISDFNGNEFSTMSLSGFVDAIKVCDISDLRDWWKQEGFDVDYTLGDLGKVYGHQLRRFGVDEFDQLKWIIDVMRNNPRATKKAVTYINPCDKLDQALTPCHTGWETLVNETDYSKASKSDVPEYEFTLQWIQSSCDVFHGIPFNIASYAKKAKFLEAVTGMRAKGIRGILSNVHIYEPHLDAVRKQLSNDVDKYANCELKINKELLKAIDFHKNCPIDEILNVSKISDFELHGYKSYGRIQADMLPYSN